MEEIVYFPIKNSINQYNRNRRVEPEKDKVEDVSKIETNHRHQIELTRQQNLVQIITT